MSRTPKPLRTQPIRVLQVVAIMDRAGLETMLMNYYRAIDRDKIQFDFLVHRDTPGDYDDEIMSLGGRIYRLPEISLGNMLRYRRLFLDFISQHPEYHIIHSHLDALSALPLSAARAAGIPVRIAHSHTSSFDKNAKYPIRQIAKKFIKLYATDFFGCTKDAIDFMFGKSIPSSKVIHNAIDAAVFRHDKTKRVAMQKALGLDNNHLVIGHVGRFSYPKNHSFLIDIFAQLHKKRPNTTLLLVGSGDGEANIKQKVVALGLENSVKFLGLRPDIPDIMQAMDVFVMPSLYEGLPVVSIEAQAAGLQCVFSDVVTSSLDVTGNCTFIGLDESPQAWASKIIALSHRQRADQSQQIAAKNYDSHTEADKLSKFYTDHANQ